MEDIFSKEPLKKEPLCPNPKTPIIVDTREKQSLIAAHLLEQKANICFEKLEIGDYLIGETVIERKTINDFINSISNKRLISQLKDLTKYDKKFLLLEGFYYNYEDFNMNEKSIKGMLLSIATDFKIPILFSKNEKDTSSILILTAKKYEKKNSKKAISLRHLKETKTIEEKKKFILEGFPHIGPTNAQKLIDNLGSLKNIFDANENVLKKCSTLDEKTIKEFKKLLEE